MSPDSLLAVGTRVYVNGRIGRVVRASMQPAHPCGMVAVHTVKFPHRREGRRQADGSIRTISKPIAEKIQTVNYSHIQVILGN